MRPDSATRRTGVRRARSPLVGHPALSLYIAAMRYIGNKTRLLGFIRRVLAEREVQPGIAVDPFSGTTSVARALKRWGFSVVAADIMEYAHVLARAFVVVSEPPRLPWLADIMEPASESRDAPELR